VTTRAELRPADGLLPTLGFGPWAQAALLLGLGFAIGYLGQTASLRLWFQPQRFSTIWIPGGLLLAALLLTERRRWLPVLLGVGGGGIIALLPLTWAPHRFALIYGTVCSATALAAHVLTRIAPSPFRSLPALGCFVGIACVLLPLFSGGATALIAVFLGPRSDFVDAWLTQTPSHATSFLLLAPLVLAVAEYHRPVGSTIRAGRAEAALMGAGMLALSWGLWTVAPSAPQTLPLQLAAPVPLLLLAALRFGPIGSSAGLLLVAIPAAWLGVYRAGPFAALGGQANAHLLQLWLFAMGLLVHAVAVQARQRMAITAELAESQGRIQGLAARLLHAQEVERARLARELHDGVNQQLALAAIRASGLRQSAAPSGSAGMAELEALLRSTSEDVRRISHNLHPGMLEHVGLVPALRALVDEAGEHWDGTLRFTHEDGLGRPDAERALALYRIAQEGLSNAIRHAGARRIELRLSQAEGAWRLMVEDDGRGFDPIAAGQGLGLLSMQERAGLLGGSVALDTRPGGGTRLWVSLPAMR